ncbi:glycoside hydrolase [Lophium mytilinum]|uniref:Alpha-galactosidase n=1 Tax=Lophium mytilinum TaxID=390894 RepID=A0A6A6QZT9_9PEZI|nr:glycoside hydrolase [Lophium mytilinum]
MISLFVLLLSALSPSPITALVRPLDVGKLPALGWNSWNAFNCDINETKFLVAANKLVDLGLKDVGYNYVNIDDCWQVKDKRNETTGRMIPDPDKFPDGIKGTSDKIHALGLKIGIYSSAGTKTCAGYVASIGNELIDATTFADWGIDYLKYDNCNVPAEWADECDACVPDSWASHFRPIKNGTCTDKTGLCPDGYDFHKSNTAERFRIMGDALKKQNRTILYSLCEWGEANPQQWGNDTAASWRMSGDISPSWSRIVEILNENSFYLNYVDFWGHADPDMLEVGNGDLTPAETRSHFALWAAMKSPLLIGTALDKLSDANVAILKNKHLLAFNQDAVVGKPAMPYKWGTNPDWTFNATWPAEFWAGDSQAGVLVLLFNPAGETVEKFANFTEIPGVTAGEMYEVVDIWTDTKLGCFGGGVVAHVDSHDTAGFLLKKGCGYGYGYKRGKRSSRIWS